MKTHFLLVTIPLIVASGIFLDHDTPIISQQQRIYFYIDHGCECQPTPDMNTGKYWIVTSEIFSADSSRMSEISSRYKNSMKDEFGYHDTSLSNVVVRYQHSRRDALESRRAKIKKMTKEGYHILETKYSMDKY